ncbi:MAG: hypothetical protein AAFY52_05365 [Pseudomonadota bacterium]
MKLINRTLGALALFALSALPGMALEPIKGATFSQVAQISLSDKAQKALERFRRTNDAFGAFFISEDGQHWTWYADMFSAKTAAKVAEIECETHSRRNCVLLARINPKNDVGELGVPSFALKGYREMVRKTGSGNFAAMAINGLSGWGSAFDFSDVSDARERALLECEAQSASEKADMERDVRQAFEKNKIFDCRIVFTMQKR